MKHDGHSGCTSKAMRHKRTLFKERRKILSETTYHRRHEQGKLFLSNRADLSAGQRQHSQNNAAKMRRRRSRCGRDAHGRMRKHRCRLAAGQRKKNITMSKDAQYCDVCAQPHREFRARHLSYFVKSGRFVRVFGASLDLLGKVMTV